jgi:hypothetical protein
MSSVKLKHSSGNGTIINAPAANPSADITLKVPSTTGSAGQALKIASANHSSTNAELEWGGAGKILQVLQSVKTNASSSTTKESWLDIAGTDQAGSGSIFCVKITPSAATSKILFTAVLNVGTTTSNMAGLTLYRDSTILQQGDAATNLLRTTTMMYIPAGNNKTVNLTMQHLDSPSSTSELTYKVKYYTYNTDNFWVNRSDRDSASVHYDYRPSSALTVMEVGA